MADQRKLRLDTDEVEVDSLNVEELDRVAGGVLEPTDTCPIENYKCTNTCPAPPATSVE